MDEFLKMSWRIRDLSELEQQPYFIAPDVLSESYVYKNLEKKIVLNAEEKPVRHGVISRPVPGPPLASPYNQVSSLTESQHHHCLKALKLHQSGRDPLLYNATERYSVKIYNELQAKIIQENREYLAAVRKVWEDICQKQIYKTRLKPKLFNYAKEHFQQKLKRYQNYSRYYQQLMVLNTSYNELETGIEFNCIANLLEVGTLARFVLPNLKSKCHLKVGGIPRCCDEITNSKLPVSQDANIVQVITRNPEIDVVISGGSLKTILDVTSINKEWIIPVVLKKISIGGSKVLKTIVFIDNPLPRKQLDISHYSYYCHKILLRAEFCQYEAFNFPNEDIPIDKSNEDTSKLDDESSDIGRPKTHHKGIYHNVSYRLWSVNKTSFLNQLVKHKTKDVHINLLVRCKLDACEKTDQGQLQPVIVRPKVEHQLQFGASIPSKMELSREWTSLFFRPYSYLYRVRVDNNRSEVVSSEKCSMQKIITEAQTLYNYKPVTGLGVLQIILENLLTLEEGNYILRHTTKDGNFVALMKSSPENSAEVFDLHAEQKKCSFLKNANVNPLPMDVNYILQAHEETGRMPGMFRPFVTLCAKNKKNKGSKANKAKQANNANKAKQANKAQEAKQDQEGIEK